MNNPIRRNRNIGTTQGGRVKSGRAEEKMTRSFGQDIWTRLSEDSLKWQVIREHPSRDYFHPASGEEYIEVLSRLPDDITRCVKAIVLRRCSKEDEEIGVEARRRYWCVLLNSFPKSMEMVWHKRPTVSSRRHYDAWCQNWKMVEGIWRLVWTPSEIKRYYLYHLFLHETGHINQPPYHSLRRRESFAENFALEWARRLGVL